MNNNIFEILPGDTFKINLKKMIKKDFNNAIQEMIIKWNSDKTQL